MEFDKIIVLKQILKILSTLSHCMSKKEINQNTNYDSELLNSIGSNFIFLY